MQSLTLLIPLLALADVPSENPTVIVVVGAPGNAEYAQQFSKWADNWKAAAATAGARYSRIGHPAGQVDFDDPKDGEILKQTLADLKGSASPSIWLVLIGHGTFDGKRAKFNLRGPDVTAEELAQWIQPISKPIAIINCTSASGPFINRLSGPNRVIVTATKSGYQHNFSRFGEHISRTISDKAADLDKDGQTSLLEAFLSASAGVRDFYQEESRLATEHALIDDNGDGQGTPADWFRGFRAVRKAKAGAVPDFDRANQFVLIQSLADQHLSSDQKARRNELELEIAKLRSRKSQLAEDDYYRGLEPLLIKLARLYRLAESQAKATTKP